MQQGFNMRVPAGVLRIESVASALPPQDASTGERRSKLAARVGVYDSPYVDIQTSDTNESARNDRGHG